MADFSIIYRDTLPTLSVTLKDGSGTAVDLTNADNVKLHLLKYADSEGGVPRTAPAVVTKTMTVNATPTTGIVTYTFAAADYGATSTTLAPGSYYMEFEVNGPTTSKLTIPTPPTRYTMFIRDDLD